MPVRRFSFESATVWALTLTLALAAIVLIPSASIPFLYTKSAVLAGGGIITLILYVLARLTRGNIILPPSLLFAALWLPVLAYALSAIFSGTSFSLALFGDSFSPDTLGFMLTAAVLGSLAALALRRPEQYRSLLLIGFYVAGAVMVLQVLIILVGQVAPGVVSPAASLLGSYADLAAFAGLLVTGILTALRLLPIASRLKIAMYVAGALALFILAVANSALVWVLVALVALGLFVEAVMRRSPSTGDADLEGVSLAMESDAGIAGGERMLGAPLIALIIALFFLIGGNLGNALAGALHVSVLDVRPSWGSTLTVGKQVYAHSPLFGSGPTTFGTEWLKFRDATLNQTVFWNLDFTSGIGFIPTSMVTTGVVGALAWLLFFAALLYLTARSVVLRAASDPFIRFVTTLAAVGALYLFVVAIFANAGVVILALAFVFTGLLASALRFSPGKTQWGVIFARSPRIGFVIVFGLTLLLLAGIVMAYVLTERYVAQVDLSRAQAALSAGNADLALTEAGNSIAFVPSVNGYLIEAAAAQAQMSKIASDTSLPAAQAQQQFQQALANGVNAALAATRLSPDNYQAWLALGNLYASVVSLNVDGAYDNAKAAFDKAATLNPTSPAIPYAVAQLDIANKDTKAAEADLTKAISLKQDYTPAIFLFSQLEVSTGNLKDALSAAEAAAYFTPNDPNVLFQVGILRAAEGDTAGATSALQSAVALNGQFANARYFLAALYAKKADYADASTELAAIAALSDDNAKAVAPLLAALKESKNPFPANLLSVNPPVGE